MIHRRKILAVFVLLAVLCLGVGYASLSDSLLVQGSASARYEDVQRRFDENLYFYDAVIESEHKDCPDGCEATLTLDDDIAELRVYGFGVAGDSIQAVFIINNDNTDVDAKFALPKILIDGQPYNEYFQVTTDWNEERTVKAGGNTSLKVTVTLIRTPLHLSVNETMSADFTIQLDADAVTD